MRVEARAVDSCVYLCGIPDVDALVVALRLEGCRFPLRISHVPTDALGPSVRHVSWDRHQDWVVDEGVALMKVNEIFLVPSVFLCRAYPGSVATIDEQIRFGHLAGAQPPLYQSRQVYGASSIELLCVDPMSASQSFEAFAINPGECTDPDDAFDVRLCDDRLEVSVFIVSWVPASRMECFTAHGD